MPDPRKFLWLLSLTVLALGLRVVAVVLAANGDGVALRLLSCLGGAIVVPALAWIGWSLVPSRPSIGWCAAGVGAVYPPHVLLAAAPDGRIWTMLALVTLLSAVLLPGWRATRRGAVLAGCLIGVLIPVLPAIAPAIPVFAMLFWLAEGDVSWVGRFTFGAAARLGILLGIAVLVAAPWLAHKHLTAIAASVAPAVSLDDEADGAGSGLVATQTTRLKALFLFDGAANGWGDRLDRIGTIAVLVSAAIGLYLSAGSWRSLWPTYAIVGLSMAAYLCGIGSPALRSALEPLCFLWVAWTVSMLPVRGEPRAKIRVYRPGENAHDPFEGPHVLHGPHYDVHERRRAG